MLHLLLAFAQQINKINFRCRCQNRQRDGGALSLFASRRRRRRRLRCVSFMCLVFVTKSAAAVAAAPWSRPGLGLGPGTTTGDDSSSSSGDSISCCGIFYCAASGFYGAQVYDVALTVSRTRRSSLVARWLTHAFSTRSFGQLKSMGQSSRRTGHPKPRLLAPTFANN